MTMEVPQPTVAVLGASRNQHKFGHLSVQAHLRHGYKVFPINPHAETTAGVPAYASLGQLPVEAVDRITVYLPPETGITHLDQMLALHPKEVWFNPGSESDELLTRAEQLGLPVIAACSLIDLESRS
jgi:predicted CoA-binding protein